MSYQNINLYTQKVASQVSLDIFILQNLFTKKRLLVNTYNHMVFAVFYNVFNLFLLNKPLKLNAVTL